MGPCVESTRTPSQRYPQIRIAGRTILEHRLTWEEACGPIPAGMFICHHCDNSRCVRLDHLYLGTPKDNMQDRLMRGRNSEKLKTHCKRGHPYNEENTMINDRGHRRCRTCARAWWRDWYAKKAS